MSSKVDLSDRREEFEHAWKDEVLSVKEMAARFGVSLKVINRHVEMWGLTRSYDDIVKIRQRTMLARYGVIHPEQSEEFREKRRRTMVERYGVEHGFQNEAIKAKAEQTTLERFGVRYITQSDDIKQRIRETNMERFGAPTPAQSAEVQEKIRQTNQERYGVDYGLSAPEVRSKIIATVQERYGVDSIGSSPEFHEKVRQTMMERYGAEYALQTKEGQEKRASTMMERYGSTSTLNNPELAQRARQTLMERYSVTNAKRIHISPETLAILDSPELFRQYLESKGKKPTQVYAEDLGVGLTCFDKYLGRYGLWDLVDIWGSRAEEEIGKYLEGLGVSCSKTRKVIPPYEIDLYVPDCHLGIEYNGSYWHSEFAHPKDYHQCKSKMAADKGVFLYHVFDYEWSDERKAKIIRSQLANLCGKNERKLYARNCILREVKVKEASAFLHENHLQGRDRSTVKLGLYYKEELVALMTFCKPRFNQNYDWELSRFCCKCGTTVTGGASKLFSEFLRRYSGSVVSYSNEAKTKGTMYESLGFTLSYVSAPNYVWVDSVGNLKTRYQTQMTDEVEKMHEEGYFRVYDCGNKVWVLNR